MMPWSYGSITIPQGDETGKPMEKQGRDGVRRGRKEETTRQDTKHLDVTRQKWKEQIWKEQMGKEQMGKEQIGKEQMEGMMEGTRQSTWSR